MPILVLVSDRERIQSSTAPDGHRSRRCSRSRRNDASSYQPAWAALSMTRRPHLSFIFLEPCAASLLQENATSPPPIGSPSRTSRSPGPLLNTTSPVAWLDHLADGQAEAHRGHARDDEREDAYLGYDRQGLTEHFVPRFACCRPTPCKKRSNSSGCIDNEMIPF